MIDLTKLHKASLLGAATIVLGLSLSACGEEATLEDTFLTQADIQLYLDSAPPSQQEFLADGEVTPAERERAFLNFVACASDQGVEVYDYKLTPTGGNSYSTRLASGEVGAVPDFEEDGAPIEVTDQGKIVETCDSEFFVSTEIVYSYQHRRKGDELRKFWDDMADCMRRLGADVPDGADRNQMEDINRDYANQCWLELGG